MKFDVAVVGIITAITQVPGSCQDLSKEDENELMAILNTSVHVASMNKTSIRETSGIVSVLKREEILASGARDLVDVLRLIPGFEFGLDCQSVIGISARGFWAHEGKILILLDGMEMNESLFGYTPMLNHFPVDQIKQIEVVRGPGSCLYGGSAELGIIQITTLGADDVKGFGAGVTYGQGKNAYLHRTGNLLYGSKSGDASFKVGFFTGETQLSDLTYTDHNGISYDMDGQSLIRPLMLNISMEAGKFKSHVLLDRMYLKQRDVYGDSYIYPMPLGFSATDVDFRYEWNLSQSISLTPFITVREQAPWWSTDPATANPYDAGTMAAVTRKQGGIIFKWNPSTAWNTLLGTEYYQDHSNLLPGSIYPSTFINGNNQISYHDTAAFAQVEWKGPVNLTVGGRWEDHNAGGSSFVPRAAITKAFDKWHFKLLYAEAFRNPSIMNFTMASAAFPNMVAEKTKAAEAEIGYWAGKFGFISVNIFNTKIEHPILYYSSANGYMNDNSVSSNGVELEDKQKFRSWFVNADFSLYQANSHADGWSVPGHSKFFIGAPTQKGSLLFGLNFIKYFTFNVSGVWLGTRYCHYTLPPPTPDDAVGPDVINSYSSDLLLNSNLEFKFDELRFVIGVQDALDRDPSFIQSYVGGHAPLPGPSREFFAKLRYGF